MLIEKDFIFKWMIENQRIMTKNWPLIVARKQTTIFFFIIGSVEFFPIILQWKNEIFPIIPESNLKVNHQNYAYKSNRSLIDSFARWLIVVSTSSTVAQSHS